MAKGGRVKGIRVKAPLRENAQKIIQLRLQELLQWRHALADANAVSDLHDMRIAAKRLRYAFEIFDVCFPSKPILNKLTAIQESVGDIHDLDVLTEIIRTRLARVDEETESKAVEIVRTETSQVERGNQLRRLLYAQARDRRRLGLLGLLGEYVAQRATLFAEFQTKWGGVALDSFASDVLEAIGLGENVHTQPELAAADHDAFDAPSGASGQSATEKTERIVSERHRVRAARAAAATDDGKSIPELSAEEAASSAPDNTSSVEDPDPALIATEHLRAHQVFAGDVAAGQDSPGKPAANVDDPMAQTDSLPANDAKRVAIATESEQNIIRGPYGAIVSDTPSKDIP